MGLSKFLLLAFVQLSSSQYAQTYQYVNIPTGPNSGAFVPTPFWTPSPGGPRIQGVVPFNGVGGVVLQYNCAYLKDICVNAQQFMASTRGQARQQAGISDMYAFDMNGGKTSSRNARRRGRSCPGRWKAGHICPEAGNPPQSNPMRQDGPWFTTALEYPNKSPRDYYIMDNHNVNPVVLSNIIYSCDEFPPASFVEGGTAPNPPAGTNANNQSGAANTRCAGQVCQRKRGSGISVKGIRAEQDWQSTAHAGLRRQLIGIIQSNLAMYPGWDNNVITNNFAMFRFAMVTANNGVAAKVITFSDYNNPAIDTYNVNQMGGPSVTRREAMMGDAPLLWFHNATTHQLRTEFDSEEIHILANPMSDRPEHQTRIVRRSALRGRDLGEEETELPPLLKRASPIDLTKARAIVEAALAKTALLNAARYANPLRNQYLLRPGTVLKRSDQPEVPALLDITDDIAAAAALVAEADAVAKGERRAKRQSGTYWMQNIARQGTVPWGDSSSYKVYRNVRDYGAAGDGTTDDTAAIKNAMTDGNRCGKGCNGSTTKNAIVYFPPGKYLVSSTIPMPFGTQVIGDANNWPTLVASSTFIGLGVLSTDEYTGGGIGPDGLDQEYYINTANFYRQIRNMRIDVTATRSASQVAGLHYQVAQASSLQNLELIADSKTKQRGIFAENGSGGVMSDITFTGGAFGLYGGNQQFTSQRLTFNGCATGVQVIWDWGWVWKSITMNNVDVGFRLLQENKTTTSKRQAGKAFNGNIGSAEFMDSTFNNVNTAVLIAPPNSKTGSGSTGVVIDNCVFSGVGKAVADTNGNTQLAAPSGTVSSWILGPVYSSSGNRTFSTGGKVGNFRRPQNLLDNNGKFFERAKPQYESSQVGDFVHVKDLGAKGDGSTDDTSAFQNALYQAISQGKILFVDAGSYILTGTVTIPTGSRIVGEAWSQLVASGSYFSDANNPKVLIKVGNQGDYGTVEMQDLLFTTRGPTAGLIAVEWNMQATSNGAAALWDCHIRIGGATGTQLTSNECPAAANGTAGASCNAGSLMLHVTPSASGYFDNMWLWVADHMIDDPDTNNANNSMTQLTIYVARGALIESTQPTWFYGSASEHSTFYQYNFNKAKNTFAGLLQTESPYYQPVPKPPAPYANIAAMSGDPSYNCAANDPFSGCDASWAVMIQQSGDIFIAGAGLYSWFSSYTQDCVDSQTCQNALVLLKNNLSGVRFQNLITIGAKYMIAQDGVGIKASDNLNVNTHPYWSQISVFDVNSNGTDPGQMIWLDPAIWSMDTPTFTCSPPCTVKIPPWMGATSTVNYPFVTVSSGTWTSTLTAAPFTNSYMFFSAVTLTAAPGGKRQAATPSAFWPTPFPISKFPAMSYAGVDGTMSTATPSDAFPTPVASIGPNAPPPPGGNWPKKAIQPVFGNSESPLVDQCSFPDFACGDNFWVLLNMLIGEDFGGDPSVTGEPWDPINCDSGEDSDDPITTSSTPVSTMSSTTTSSTSSFVSPMETPDPENNPYPDCYNSGTKTNHARMDSAINNFCKGLAGIVPSNGTFPEDTYKYLNSAYSGNQYIVTSMQVKPGCGWKFNQQDCQTYLQVPVNSCNCGGTDGKQGGVLSNNCLIWRVDPNVGGSSDGNL